MTSKRYPDLRYPLFIIPIVLVLGFFNLAWAAPTEIYSIIPDMGSNKVPTQVTIDGSGIQPTPTVALYGGDQQIGSCDTPDSAHGVYVTGTYAYVTDELSGLQVIDISDPVNPRIVGSCDTPGLALGVYVTGSYAYVADSGSGLLVIEKFSLLADIHYIDSNTLTATVPPGYRLGTYDLYVTNPDGGHAVLHNAFASQEEFEVTMALPAGWSMISLPIRPYVATLTTIFPDAVVLYKYQKGTGYVRVQKGENLEVSRGYWILLNNPRLYVIRGTEITEYTISIEDGWYMIGGCSMPAQTMVTTGSIDVIYEYTQGTGYTRILGSESLEQGKGYWIFQ